LTAEGPASDPVALGPESRRALLALARLAVTRAVHGEPLDEPGAAPPGLDRPGAAFVTLRVAGQLKGCIGSFEPRPSLWQAVSEMAAAAATRDPRFPGLGRRDLAQLAVEISVLSPGQPLRGPADLEIGRHGIEVRRGTHRGLLLPQVATDHHLDRETFLIETCRKAGLPADAWRLPETEVNVFEADVFGDG
jgi:uncharacterized protein